MIRAVLGDTWQQSKQQGVFITMLAVMAIVLVASIAIPRALVTAEGEKTFGTIFSDSPFNVFSQQWVNAYVKTLDVGGDEARSAAIRKIASDRTLSQASKREQLQVLRLEQQRLRNEAVSKASTVPEYQRAVEYYVHFVIGGTFTLSILFFIAACAGYFPAMLSSGAVDIVLSKPINRWKIYWGKYLGGIVLYAVAMLAFSTLLFIGIGIRTGIWQGRIFYSIPLLVFTAMVLYSLLALIGTIGKSATLSIVLGYVFYLVVDSLVGVLIELQPQLSQMGWESVGELCAALRYVLPNFGVMKDMALASLLNAPLFQATPFFVALVWLFGCLGLGYWVFDRRDY